MGSKPVWNNSRLRAAIAPKKSFRAEIPVKRRHFNKLVAEGIEL